MKTISVCILLAMFFMSASAQTITLTPTQAAAQSFKELIQSANSVNYGNNGASIMTVTVSEGTKGSPYLTNWVSGNVSLNTGAVYNEPGATLNFDKIKQILVLKLSSSKVFEVDMKTVKSFELNDTTVVHKFVPLQTNRSEEAIELYKDSLRALYKTIHTEFFKSDYVNSGMFEKGDKYDRYEDKVVYYIKIKKGDLVKIEAVNKKRLKQLDSSIPGIADAVNASKMSTSEQDQYLVELLKAIPVK